MVAGDLDDLLDTIDALLRERPSGGAAAVARIEQTLTDGYALALELEADHWRVERQIAEAARRLADGDRSVHPEELSALYGRAATIGADVGRLRGRLTLLRRHADAVRAA